MSSFLEKFKGKTNLIGKDGIITSLDKKSTPIQKNKFIIKDDDISIKSAMLPIHSVQKNNKVTLRERKIHSFSSQSNKNNVYNEKPEKNNKNVGKFVKNYAVKTENDLPSHQISKKYTENAKKLSPAELRMPPVIKKNMMKNLKTEENLYEKKQILMEKIEEKDDEFEEAQRMHYEFLNKVEKLHIMN